MFRSGMMNMFIYCMLRNACEEKLKIILLTHFKYFTSVIGHISERNKNEKKCKT